MTIGERIRNRRISCGISQQELAEAVGYRNRASITKIEKNLAEIPQSTVYKIAIALNTSPQYLMGWTDDASAYKTKEAPEAEPQRLTETQEELIEMVKGLDEDQAHKVQQLIALLLGQ